MKEAEVYLELRLNAESVIPEVKKAVKNRARVRSWNDNVKCDDTLPLAYDQLDGEWKEWLKVAEKFEGKVPLQDRLDVRHNIILELALARAKTDKPIPIFRAYRIASFMIADYWRQQKKLSSGLDCHHCSKNQRAKCQDDDLYSDCPKLVKVVSLDAESVDAEGNIHTLKDTVADDNAIDLDAWLDIKTWLLGCPIRLVQIAQKKVEGETLTQGERKYLWKLRKRSQKILI